MADITQKFGFDAGGAISTIGNLNKALAALTTNLRNVAGAAGKLNTGATTKPLGELSRTAKAAGVQLEKLGKKGAGNVDKVNKAVNRANKSTKSFNISLETLSRIAIAQGIVRGLNTIQSKFSEAVDTAVELGSTLAEAAAISPRGIGDFAGEVSRLNDELIKSSNEFGLDIVDLASAKYQEFSNQVKGAAESSALFNNANRLAVITGTSATQAVDALSSVLNSYGESVNGAERASAILFKTIELSRAKLSEIAGQLGNVTPLARSAGISFIEVGAALSVITQGGTGASRALTQIRGLINQLQKPTVALQKIFTEVFKVQNIQQAITKFGGLEPVLQALQVEAAKTSSGFSKIFTNIRARTAITRLTQDTVLMSSAVDKLSESADNAESFLGDLLEKFQEQDAQKFKVALQELNNTFLTLAQDALPALTTGLSILTAGVDNLGIIANGVAVLIAIKLVGSFKAATLAAVTMKGAMLGATLTYGTMAVAAGLAIAAVVKIFDKFTVDKFTAETDGLAESVAEAMQVIADEAKEAEKALREFSKSGAQSLAAFQAAAFEVQTAIKVVDDAFISSVKSSLDSVVGGREAILKKLESIISGFASRTDKRTKDSAKINQKIEDTAFERRIKNFSDTREATARQIRAEASLAKAQQTPVDTTEDLQKRRDLLQESLRLAEQSASAAASGGTRGQELRAAQTVLNIQRQLLGVNTALQTLDKARRVEASKVLSIEKTRVDNLKDATKEYLALLSAFNQDKTPKDLNQIREETKLLADQHAKITKFALESDDLNVADIVGLVGLQDRIANDLEGVSPKFTKVRNSITQALQDGVADAILNPLVKVSVQLAQESGASIDDFSDLNPAKGLTESRDFFVQKLADLTQGTREYKEAVVEVNAASIEFQKQAKDIVDSATAPSLLTSVEASKAAGVAFKAAIAAFIANPAALDSITKLDRALLQLDKDADLPGFSNAAEKEIAESLVAEAFKLRKATEDRAAAAKLAGGTNIAALEAERTAIKANLVETQKLLDLKELEKFLGNKLSDSSSDQAATNSQKIAESSGKTAVSSKEINTNTEGLPSQLAAGASATATFAENMTRLAREADKAAKAVERASSAGGGGSATSKMFGGPLYRAGGGFVPRGSDTIPAMLSPGETVINARSSRRFASQIASMNAGTTPVYRANGGVVNNNSVNVGDINVNGTANPDDTARRVVSQIRREFRRGTSSRL